MTSAAGGEGGAGSFGLELLRLRLEETWEAHRTRGCDDGDLRFSARSMFGIQALYGECTRCSFLETVM